jgi:hypothetical protein
MKRTSFLLLSIERANNIDNMTLAAFDFIIVMIHIFSIFAIIEHITYEKLHNKKPSGTFCVDICVVFSGYFAFVRNGYLWVGAQQAVVIFPFESVSIHFRLSENKHEEGTNEQK